MCEMSDKQEVHVFRGERYTTIQPLYGCFYLKKTLSLIYERVKDSLNKKRA